MILSRLWNEEFRICSNVRFCSDRTIPNKAPSSGWMIHDLTVMAVGLDFGRFCGVKLWFWIIKKRNVLDGDFTVCGPPCVPNEINYFAGYKVLLTSLWKFFKFSSPHHCSLCRSAWRAICHSNVTSSSHSHRSNSVNSIHTSLATQSESARKAEAFNWNSVSIRKPISLQATDHRRLLDPKSLFKFDSVSEFHQLSDTKVTESC